MNCKRTCTYQALEKVQAVHVGGYVVHVLQTNKSHQPLEGRHLDTSVCGVSEWLRRPTCLWLGFRLREFESRRHQVFGASQVVSSFS